MLQRFQLFLLWKSVRQDREKIALYVLFGYDEIKKKKKEKMIL